MAKKRIDRSINLENKSVTFTVLESGDTITAAVKDFPEDIINRLILHGINAKIGDSAADPNADAREALASTIEQLKQGTWAVRGQGGGGPRVTVLAEALSKISGQEIGVVVDKLDAMSPEERRDIPKKYPKVKAAMDEIKAARAAEAAKKSKQSAKNADEDDEALAALLG